MNHLLLNTTTDNKDKQQLVFFGGKMLTLTEQDKTIIETSYIKFLNNLKNKFAEMNVTNVLEIYKTILYLIQNGNFCYQRKIAFDENFDYLFLSNMDRESIHVMYGVGVCRHLSELVCDILNTLSFPSSLLYIYIDDKNNWHKLKKAHGANHVVVFLKDYNYLLDPLNHYAFKIEDDLSLTHIIQDDNEIKKKFIHYYDDNITSIGKVLQKYYNLKKLGVKYTYE